MIALDLKQETPTSTTASLLSSKGEKSEGVLSFSTLLKGIKEGDKAVQNGALVLSLNDAKGDVKSSAKGSKSDTLLSLLGKNEKSSKESKALEFLEINPEIKAALSPKYFKLLIKDAKAYLKNQIISSEGFKRAEIEKLPKTLKGLLQVAKKIGIDISKITLEAIRPQIKSAETKNDAIQTLDVKKEAISKKQTNSVVSLESVALDVKAKHVKKDPKTKVDAADEAVFDEQIKAQPKPVPKETPLFKMQKSAEISTQQMVSVKTIQSNGVEATTPKKRADETLKLLLQGEKIAKKEGSRLTSDFSVATAKVIAPHAKGEAAKTLESLLKSDSSDDESTTSKTDGLQVAKADSFEVKLNEAKQMVKYLSQDVKQAIDNYKAPFTRVKLQLNPQKLGEVDVTIVQRGKNLHVNLSSNNTAINTLALNANDLKVQLQNSGIQNASLNFNNNSQGGEFANGGQAQQQQQQRQNAHDEYNYFENEEMNEEIVNSLEIVVPNYA